MNRKKIMYSILKEIEQGNEPKPGDYDLDLESWGSIAEMIKDGEYAKPVLVARAGVGNKIQYAMYPSSNITEKGQAFLEENSTFSKTYKGLKEIRDWFKL